MPTVSYRTLHFDRTHRLLAAVSRRMNFTYTIRRGLAAGMRRRGGLGFVPWGVDTHEMRFLRALDISGAQTVYDIGAFEGLLTMFFSRQAKQVVAWEPNPASRSRLITNLSLNRITNVVVRDVGLSDVSGEATLVYDPLMPGAASAAAAVASQIREGAPSIVEAGMRIVRLDDDVREQSFPPPDLVKIDVEGMELAVLRGAESTLRACRPAVYIELHGAEDADKRQNARDVVSWLWSCGYCDILRVETGETLEPQNAGRPSHIFCRSLSTEAV